MEQIAVRELTPIEDKQDQRLVEDTGINLKPLAYLTAILFMLFLIQGVITYHTWTAIESPSVSLTRFLFILGATAAACATAQLWFTKVPGIWMFLSYYVVVVLSPFQFTTGISMLVNERYIAGDYFNAVQEDTEYWEGKYGDTLTVEQATGDALSWLQILGITNIIVGVIILLTLLPFGRKMKEFGSLRVLSNVIVIALSVVACGLAVVSFLMMNLYHDKQLVEEVDRTLVIFTALIAMAIIAVGIAVILMISGSRKGPTIGLIGAMFVLALLGAYLGYTCHSGATLYDPHLDENGNTVDTFICSDVMGRVADDNLRQMGCFEKFQAVEDCPPKA